MFWERTTGRVIRTRMFLAGLLLLSFIPAALAGEKAADEPDRVKELVKGLVQASGGKEALESAKAVHATGSVTAIVFGDTGTYERWLVRDAKLRVDIKYTRSSELRVLNGGYGFESFSGAPVRRADGSRLRAMIYQYKQLDLPYELMTGAYKITYAGKSEIDGIPVDALDLKDAVGPPMKVYIDPKTFLIRKVSGFFSVGKNSTDLSAEFSDYRKVDGLMLPYRITNYAGGTKIGYTDIRTYEINPKYEETLFLPPVSSRHTEEMQ